MKFNQIFSGKRQAIDKAKSTVFLTLVVAAIVISFSIVTLNFLWNLRGYNSRVLGEKQKARTTLAMNVENAQQLKQAFEIFENGDIKSKEVLDALPSKYDFAAIITSMDALAKRSGMVLDGFVGTDESEVVEQSSTTPLPVPIPFTVTVVGRYADLKKFISNLDRSIRPMQLDSISISGSDNNIKAEIFITTYYQPQANINVETKQIQ